MKCTRGLTYSWHPSRTRPLLPPPVPSASPAVSPSWTAPGRKPARQAQPPHRQSLYRSLLLMARMADAHRPATAVARRGQAGWHTFPSGRTAWLDEFARPDDIITLTRPAAKYQTREEADITYERLMDRTRNQRRQELVDKQINAIVSSTGVDWSRHKCKSRSQAELIRKLGTEDVVSKRQVQEERAKRAIRRIEAGRLVRVTTLGREEKDRMLQAPSSPRHRLRREASAPTRLSLMGDDALTMEPDAWSAELKAQRRAPKAAIWCAPPPLLLPS